GSVTRKNKGGSAMTIKGDAKFCEPGRSFVAGAEPRFLGDATFATTWDLANGRGRTAWDRVQKSPDRPVKLKYTETVLQRARLRHGRKEQPADVRHPRRRAST